MANKEKNFVSAIVYVHNAESRIESFLSTVLEVLETNFEHSEMNTTIPPWKPPCSS